MSLETKKIWYKGKNIFFTPGEVKEFDYNPGINSNFEIVEEEIEINKKEEVEETSIEEDSEEEIQNNNN